MVKALERHWVALLAGALGASFFAFQFGLPLLDPTNIGWLKSGDWAQHFIGWTLFRNEPLSFPLGRISGALHPLGTTVGFMDGLPWMAMIFRPFAAILPERFQYIGIWLALCFLLQGFVGAKLVRLLGGRPFEQLVGGVLFATAWPLAWRIGHEALCAHWLLLAELYFYFAGADTQSVRRRVLGVVGVSVLAAGIHPYLTAMTICLAGTVLFRYWAIDRALSWRGLLGAELGLLSATLGVLFVFGYVGGHAYQGWSGFGWFSADLTTLVNPMWWSRWVDSLGAGEGQYEGFAYLGTGLLLGAVVSVVSVFWSRPEGRGRAAFLGMAPLLVVCLIMAVYSFSPSFTFRGRPLVDGEPLFASFSVVTRTFRSNGRFIWPLFYLVILFILKFLIEGMARWQRPRAAVFVGMVVLQLGELRPLGNAEIERGPWPEFTEAGWSLAKGEYRNIVLYPPQVTFEGTPCPGTNSDQYVTLSYLAYKLGMTINSGRVAKLSPDAARSQCLEVQRAVGSREFRPDDVYVVDRGRLDEFRGSDARVICGELDGQPVCVDAGRRTRFSEHLRAQRLVTR